MNEGLPLSDLAEQQRQDLIAATLRELGLHPTRNEIVDVGALNRALTKLREKQAKEKGQ